MRVLIQIERTETFDFMEEVEDLDAAKLRADELVDEVAAGEHESGDFFTDVLNIEIQNQEEG